MKFGMQVNVMSIIWATKFQPIWELTGGVAARKRRFGQVWPFLAFFGMLWAISSKISIARSIYLVEFEFGQFLMLQKNIITIEIKISPGADILAG